MRIIEYKEEYQNQVIDLILRIQRDEFKVDITLEDQPDLKEIPRYYSNDSGNFWLALEGNRVIGTIAVVNLENGNAALKKMFVDSSFRGSEYGVGAGLMESLLNDCKKRGRKAIFLGTTNQFKAAHRFYEKNGFQQIHKGELPTDFPLVDVDTIFYKKVL